MIRARVVIPAHDEAAVIDRCLTSLFVDVPVSELDVIVVANGCVDETAQRARAHPGVQVVELAEAGKIGALNAGDAAASALPRIYLDADVELCPGALPALIAALDRGTAIVACPAPVFRTAGRPWSVRAFYDVYTRLPYVREGLVGLGVYALSPAGRGRFETFPDITADDLFVQRLFAPGERVVPAGCEFVIQTPHALGQLLAVRSRSFSGAAELAQEHQGDPAFGSTTGSSARALGLLVVRDPRLLPAALVYGGVVVAARLRARRRTRPRWERDQTSR